MSSLSLGDLCDGVSAARRREAEGFFSRKIPTPEHRAPRDRHRYEAGGPSGRPLPSFLFYLLTHRLLELCEQIDDLLLEALYLFVVGSRSRARVERCAGLRAHKATHRRDAVRALVGLDRGERERTEVPRR